MTATSPRPTATESRTGSRLNWLVAAVMVALCVFPFAREMAATAMTALVWSCTTPVNSPPERHSKPCARRA